MNTTSSEIITRALGISDLVNATNITYNDKVKSLNEGYRLLYNALLNSDDDYYLTEVVIPILPSYINPTSLGQWYEYIVPLPTDVERIRFLDYNGNGQWQPMLKYPMSMKDMNPGNVYYRWRNQALSIIGGGFGTPLVSIRLGYYPTFTPLSLPEATETLGDSLALATQITVNNASFTDTYVGANINTGNGSLGRYVYVNGQNIVCEDLDLGTITTLATVVGTITNCLYYQGYVYYTIGTALWRMLTNLTSVGTPVSIATVPFAPSRINIIPVNDVNATTNVSPPYLVFVSDVSTNMILYTASGTIFYNAATISTSYSSFFSLKGRFYAYILGGLGFLRFNGTTFLTGVGTAVFPGLTSNRAYSDGVYLYTTKNGRDSNIYKHTVSDDGLTITDTEILATDCDPNMVWRLINGKIVYNNLEAILTSISTQEDTAIVYPNNFVPELLSYQCALSFIAKQHGDPDQVSEIYKTLFKEYQDSLQRDNYQVERIKSDGYFGNYSWFR